MAKTSIFNGLILLSLICFGIFGSLSHVFNLGLVIFLIWHYFNSRNEFSMEPSAKKLHFALCSIFFVFLIRGMFHSDILASLKSLSPMVAIPIIGLMILLTPKNSFSISAQKVENYAKTAIATTFIVYVIFSQSLAFRFGLTEHFIGRLEIFSGNAIPFSMAVFGVSIFCLANWKFSKNSDKLIAIICLLIGFWLADIIWNKRNSLAIIIGMPILIWLVTKSFSVILFAIALTLVIFWLLYTEGVSMLGSTYTDRLVNGFDTILGKNVLDNSMRLRMELWSSSISAIRDNLFWGYDNSNRFAALSTHLPEGFEKNLRIHTMIFLQLLLAPDWLVAFYQLSVSLSPVFAGLFQKIISTKRFS